MANISQEVNIEMLEKLADGTYKKKHPETKASQVIVEDGSNLESHLAEDAQQAHLAKNIGFSNAEMTATNVEEGILEAFMLGNSTKEDLVDKLLLVDDSLLIDYDSSWQDVLNSVNQISTGKKWVSGSQKPFEQVPQYNLVLTNLGFQPSVVIWCRDDGIVQGMWCNEFPFANNTRYLARATVTGSPSASSESHTAVTLYENGITIPLVTGTAWSDVSTAHWWAFE